MPAFAVFHEGCDRGGGFKTTFNRVQIQRFLRLQPGNEMHNLIATPFNARFAEDDSVGPQWAGENLTGRWGKPEDVAGAALYLASEGSGYMSGESINLDGGSIAALVRSGELR